MNIEKNKINASVKGTDYENFLLDLNKKTALNKDVETLFEKLYTDFNLRVIPLKEDFLPDEEMENIIQGYNSPLANKNLEFLGLAPNQGAIENAPLYNYSDLCSQDFYLHETGHMIDYYLIQRIIKDDTENYSINDPKLQDFIKQTINFYENNGLPKKIVDYFINSIEYKTDSTKKYLYEGLSDIITLITKGKYFNKSYHEVMDVSQWNPNRFLIYGHDILYLKQLKDNETEIDKIIKEIFANYISICLLPNKEAYDLLKQIKNDKGENLQDVMNNFIADTVKKL